MSDFSHTFDTDGLVAVVDCTITSAPTRQTWGYGGGHPGDPIDFKVERIEATLFDEDTGEETEVLLTLSDLISALGASTVEDALIEAGTEAFLESHERQKHEEGYG